MASINDTKAADAAVAALQAFGKAMGGRRSDPWEVQIIERRRVPPLVLFMRREQERQAK